MSERFLTVYGTKTFYRVIGKGIPVIILHGWGGESSFWGVVQKGLADKGYRVFVPDLPGFGQSSSSAHPWDVDHYVSWLIAFIQAQSLPQLHLIGHSFGGRIGIKMAAKHPKALLSLILCASAGIKPKKTLRYFLSNLSVKIFKPFFKLPFLRLFYRFAQRILYRFAGSPDYLNAFQNRETFKKVIEEDLYPYLKRISVPTLLIWGNRDSKTPIRDAYIMKKEIPNSTLKVFDQVRHGIHREVPQKLVQEILHFLIRPSL